MRLLELGCHDGYLLAYLLDQLGSDLHVDGVELNGEAASIAQRRLDERGGKGSIAVGLAEDADLFFEPGSYDAVVAFELIEHVIDVNRLLETCERMVKPGGVVYISTPDGCFGEGQNPNHLRVFRMVDLVDLLRRHGELQGATSGTDGVGVVSFMPTPGRQNLGDLAIYAGPGWKPWGPLDIERPGVGLGGSETAAVRLAEALDKLGYTVTVYGECDGSAFKQVIFRHHSTFDPMVPRRAVIVSRVPQLFDRPIQAPARLLWMHDTDYGDQVTAARVERCTGVMVLSEWQAEHVGGLYPFAIPKIRITSNGIAPVYFTPERLNVERQLHRAIYTSSPDRGLDFLLELWPQVRFHVPDADLAFCYSDVYDAIARVRPDVARFREKVARLADQPGVVRLGSLSQPELAVEMARSGLWLHPSYCTPHGVQFNETFCIGAVEAAAAGCFTVMSRWGALPERAQQQERWTLIPEPSPGGRPDPDTWVREIVEMLIDDTPHVQSRAALDKTWDAVALDFHNEIQGIPDLQEDPLAEGVVA